MPRSLLRYAAWLDGETLLQKRKDSDGHHLFTEQIPVDRALKINALLGHRIAITDVQLIDSPGLALAFADRDFRSLTNIDPDWLVLMAREDTADASARLRAAKKRSRAGLHRSRNPRWISSAFPDDVVRQREFLAMLLDASAMDFNAESLERDAVDAGFVRDPKKRQRTLLADEQMRLGIMHALAHFGLGQGQSAAPPKSGMEHNYYQVLKRVQRGRNLPKEDRVIVDLTLKTIDEDVDPTARPFRSALQPALKALHLSSILSKRIWRTAIVAWNRALAESIGADGAHYPFLRHAVRVPLYMPSDTVTSVVSNDDRFMRIPRGFSAELREALVDMPYDFSWLSWPRVLQIVSNEQIRRRRERYLAALAERDTEQSTRRFRELVKAIADDITRHGDEVPAEGSVWFGAEHVLEHFLSAGGGTLAGGLRYSVETLRGVARWTQRESIISTLHRFDGRFN